MTMSKWIKVEEVYTNGVVCSYINVEKISSLSQRDDGKYYIKIVDEKAFLVDADTGSKVIKALGIEE
jgi:hypothetical protein